MAHQLGDRVLSFRPPALHSGLDVEELQALLQTLGYLGHETNGTFDSNTSASVSLFQGHRGLPVTGVFEDRTIAELKRVLELTRTQNGLHYPR